MQNKQKIIVIYVIIMNCNVNGIIVYFNNITKIHVVYKKEANMKKNFRKVLAMATVMTTVISLAACSQKTVPETVGKESEEKQEGLTETGAETVTGEKITLRLAHSQSPEHLIHKTAENFSKLVSEKSGGTIQIDLFPGETMGTSAEMADACSAGDVDFYIASTGQYTQRYKPFSIIEAFYMFRDRDHLFRFYESESFEKLKEGLAENCHVHILAPVYYGAREMTTSKKPLKTPEDFKGLKMRAANEPLPIAAIEALGGTPTPVAYNETYLALQQGVADGQENPPMSILAMKFYEVQDYLNLSDHQYQMMNIFMSDACKQKVSEEQLAILTEAAEEAASQHNERAIEEEQAAIQELSEHLEVVETDKAAFAEMMKPMYEKFSGEWLEGMYEDIQAIR